jgi:hypothetical protein
MLAISNCEFRSDDLGYVAACCSNLRWLQAFDELGDLLPFLGFEHLTYLALSNVSDQDVSFALVHLRSLRELKLAKLSSLSELGLMQLTQLQQLTKLKVHLEDASTELVFKNRVSGKSECAEKDSDKF